MSIDRFTRLYHLYTKKKNILIHSFIRVCILGIFIGLNSIVNAQTPCVAPYNPTPASTWGMVQKFQSSAVIWNGGTPTAGDLNGDGISEILVPSSTNTGYYVYKGDGSNALTGTLDFQIAIQSAYSSQPAIADIVSTSAGPEVIAVNTSGYVYIFANTGGTETNYLYKSTTASQYTTTSTPYVVDIDGDGKAEIVLGSDVFGIVSGALVKRVAGPALGYIGQTLGSTGTPIDVIVADIISTNSGKELIYGSKVYGINLTAGTMTVLKDLSTVPLSGIAANDNGPTAVGDMNGDGKLDIVYNGSTFVVIWDPNGTTLANTLLFKRVPPSFNYGTRGLPLIANVYNDKTTGGKSTDLPEAVIINSVSGSAGIVTAYNLNYNTTSGTTTQFIWSIATNDMSGCTGITAFDFDGNGIREIVYRDQSTLRIINGNLTTPVNYATAAVASSTWGEYPIVADLNNDGQAEIAVTGNNTLQVFASDPTTTPWRAAPNYWNQRNYRIVNINSNLTIPTTEINAASLVAYNNNAAQFQFADAVENGVASGNTNSADAQITINTVTTNCPTITVAATISNTGSYLLPAGTFVAMYDANPTLGAANLIGTFQTTATIAAGGSMNLTMTANLVALSSNVFAVVNDKGTTARPFNLSTWATNTGLSECSFTNNIDSKTFTCTDTDGDGLVDMTDLDDDNDGVLDTTEQYCTTIGASTDLYGPTYWKSISWTGGAYLAQYVPATPDIYIDGVLNNGIEVFRPGTTAIPISGDDFTATPITFTLVPQNPLYADGFSIVNDYGAAGDHIVKADIKLYTGSVLNPILMGTETIDNMIGGSSRYPFSKGYNNITTIKILVYKTQPAGTQADNGMQMGELGLYANAGTYCSDIDTDNDGTPNSKDLDSDGDGCSDAIESGSSSTATSTTTYSAFSAGDDTNSNGLLNVYESATAGVVNYSSQYDPYALSKNLAACIDTDGDGIFDLFDIDDDNDGILDAVESPDCFMKTEEWNTIDKTIQVKITSTLNTLSPNNKFSSLTDNDGAFAAVQFSTSTAQSQLNKEIFKVEFSSPTQLDALYIKKTTATEIFAATASSLQLQGSNDNFSTFTNLTAAITLPANATNVTANGVVSLTNSNKFTVTTGAGKFKYYRIYGVGTAAAYILAGIASEFYFDLNNSTYYASYFPKADCSSDTDGDGILNHQDLDSDGDLCADAKEAGINTAILTSGTAVNLIGSNISSGTTSSTLQYAIVATSGTVTATFGANGFANTLETGTESGIYSGSYKYYYANNASYNACTDTDGDGVSDLIDIDDDNDGILDAIESPSCFYTAAELSLPIAISTELSPYLTNLIGFAIDGNATTKSAFAPSQNWVGKKLFNLEALFPIPVVSLDFDLVSWALSSVAANTFKLQGSADNIAWTDLSTAQNSTATTGTFTLQNTIAPTNKYKYYRIIGVAGVSNYGGVTDIRFNLANSFIQSQYTKPTCLTGRTDGDLIPNHLDLDSDGDGCSDALEAGTTTSTTANFAFTGSNFGANGFLNTLETATESGVYTGTYYYDYATNSAISTCTDRDGDGVPDYIDLDNDNDGILDAVESPTCFYTLAELANPAEVSSELTQHTASYVIGNSIDGVGTTASAFATGQDWVGKEIFKFTADNYIAISGMSFDLASWALSSAAASTFKLQGSGDNANWKDLSAATYSTATTGTFTISNTLAPTFKFKYFRLIGVAGTSSYGGVYEARLNLLSSANASANPKNSCTNDTDGDGILNQNDLDSDGDGCPDAIEAGTAPLGTTAFGNTSFFNPSTTGVNGFANSLETATESGVYSGTYKYVRAISTALNSCLDSDGDGISNIDDIDDDNDGVLDISEMNCTPVANNATCLATPQTFGITTHCSGWNGFDYDPSPSVTIISNFDYMGLTSGIPYFDFQGSVRSSATTQVCGKMYKNYTTIPGMTYTFSVNLMSSFVDAEGIKPYLKGVDGTTGYELGATYLNGTGVRSVTFTAIGTTTTITLGLDTRTSLSYAGGNQFWHEVGFTMNGSTYQTCTIADTDNDGIPNYLDTDSDGDGCPDAVEAGTTAISSSGVLSTAKLTTSVIPAPYGNNGFANGLETSTESGAYTGTYTYDYATDATISGCKDSDGDGVPDVLDIDDDNDGVLDTIEDNCSIAIVNKTGLIITKPSTINYTFNANAISNLIDGVDNSVYVISTPTGTLNGPWLNFEFPSPKALTYLEIGHYPGQLLFSTTSTYKIQGSSDNTNWTDVSETLTYNNVATSTSGGLSTTISNIANFSSNKKAYKYYRILGIDATVGAGWATEIYFKEFTCAIPDLDGDGIPNRLDLDSDGDGCPDAVEARTTAISTSGVSSLAKLTTSIIPAPYGNNGFANGLETTSESGLYTGTYIYNYAIDATINACTDTDGDGVPDIMDLDDDNDGVLDLVECPSLALPNGYKLYTYNSVTDQTVANNVPLIIAGSTTQNVVLNQRTSGSDLTYSNTNWKLVASNLFANASGQIVVTMKPENTTISGSYVFADAMLISDGTSYYVIDNGYPGLTLAGSWTAQASGFNATMAYTSAPYVGKTATWTFDGLYQSSALACDNDGDGIPNQLDLDSDGDGCPDAKEAGVNGTLSSGSVKNGTGGAVTSTTTVANAIAAGPYGNNGLANGVETSTESGVVTYTSTYALNALVKDLVAPAITTQPLNRTVFVGTPAVLTTTVAAPPANRTLTYQWYKAGVAITGATSATYTVTTSATTANVADYYCTIGFVNSCLTTNTNTVNITVLSNPVGLTACQDGSAVLSVTKTGTNVVTYQWKKATTNLVNGAKIAGATTTSLTLTNLALADAGAYTLVATDANGAVITSLTGTITITNNTKYTIPDYTTCVTASNYTLTAASVATTSGAITTTWERSTDGGNTWSPVLSASDGVTYTVTTTTSGGTSTSTLRLSSVIAGLNGYKYRIATTNATCTNYSNAGTLNVNAAPTITAQPSNSVLCNIYATNFTAAATGSNLTYKWQTRAPAGTWTTITASNASTIDAGVVYSNFATTTLNLSASPSTENNNEYQVVFTNSCGTVTSTTAILNPTVVLPTITGGNIAVCEGTPITLTTSSSTASPTYQWYLGGATIGGATGATFNPTASGNYSVIANATGYCKSGTASATVTINPAPLVAIAQGAVLTLSGNGGIDLTANVIPALSAPGSYNYTWYKSNVLISGSPTTSNYTVTTPGSYSVRATNNSTTCFAMSPATTITELPSASVNGNSAICADGSVSMSVALAAGQTIQWESSTDGGTSWTPIAGANSATYNATPTNITSAAISITYRAVISAGTNTTTAATGTTNAIVVTANPIPTAIISNTASGTTLCAGTYAILTASSGAASPTYQWYNDNKIITGATANTYTATSSGNYSFKVTDISCDCSATSISSTVTLVSPPAAPNLTATSKIICINTTADLTVFQPLAIAGLSYEWHSASNTLSTTLVANASAVGTAGTYYLFAKNNTAGCFSNASVPFTLSIVSVTQATLTGASSPTYTIGDIPVALNASTSNPTYSLRWYAASTGGVALTAPVLPSTATAGITNYYVEQYDASSSFCTSNPRQLAAVTVKPLAPIVANIAYCQNATAVALTATPAIGGTLNWYGTAATGGTLTATATIPATGTVTNTTYYVSQTVNGVEGARAGLTVTINALPSAPSTITGTFSVTSTNSYTYSVTSVANTTYQWTLPSFITGTSTTNTISALVNSAGAGNISVIAINANGCLSPASISNISAVLYVAPPPTTSNSTYTIGDPAIPANTSTQITAATDATINYYTSNAAGSTSTSEQAIPSTAGVYTYYVSQTINGVESALVPYTVTIKPLKPVVADITYCQNDVPVALTATGTVLQWYTVSTSGTATSTAPTPSTGTATTTTYYVTQTVNGVESDRIALVVTINPTPDMPSAISGLTITSITNSEIYSVTNDASATGYVWVLPNGWTGTSSINSITATVGLSGGQIKVKAINGSCASPFSTLNVDILNVTNPPLTTDITFITGSTPSNILSNTSSLITGSTSSTINFYTSNESGTASSTSQTTPTTPGVYTYYVSQTSSIGVESILVPYTITIKPIAPPINTNNGIVGNTITYCKGIAAFALTATASTGGTLKWYTVATGGSPSNSAPTPSTSLVGTSNYYVAQVVNGVEGDRVLIIVTVNDAPSAVTATATQPTCTNSSGYIVITSPLGTGFTYSVDGSNYTNTTLFSALPAGIYYATAKNNFGCVSAPTPITINMAVAPPLSPLVTVTQPTCASTTGSIIILSSTLSTDNFSIDGGLNYQASKIFTGIAPGTYTVTTLNAGGCVSAGTTAIVNAALPIPAQPSISSSSASANICAGNTVTLTSSALTGNQWYKDGVLIAGAINQNYAPNESGNYTVIATNASGCASIPSDAQTITFNPLPIPVISNGATLAFDNCATTVITLTASNTNTSTGNTYQWYLNGNSINVGGNNSTYNANQAGNYSVVITNNGCSVTSAISKLIAAPSVNAANTAFCEGGSSLISGISTGFTSPSYQWRISTNDGLSFVNAIGAGTNSLTYTATTAGKYQLQVTDGGIVSTSCPINVTVFTNPTATITASPSAAVCVGSTIILSSNAASGTASYTYQWLNASNNTIAGATLSTYTTGVAGTYAVKVTDANGCSVNAAPSAIVFNAVPTAPVVTITNPTCSVATGTISVTTPLGVGYTYSIDGTNYSNTTGLFTGVTPGLTYNVTVKSSTGCTSNATVATIAAALVVPAQPVITGPDNINPFSLNTYSVAAVTGATSYSWNIPGYWSGVSTTNIITIKVDASAGSFSVTANSASCVSIAATKNITATILNPDVNVTDINVPVSGKLTTNDIIPAGTSYGQPGTNAANPTGASITVNADGSYTFTATTPGKYTYYVPVCAAGQTSGCPVSPLEITVLDPLAVTDKPVANNDMVTAKPGVPTTVNILANDAAGNSGGTLNTSSVSIASAPKHGVVVVNGDGTITYSPAAGFIGTDSIIYNVCDNSSPTPLCQTAVVYFTVVPSSAPSTTVAVDDYATVLASTGGTNAVSGNVLTNDKNTGGASLTATVVAGPSAAQGTFTMNANGSYTFTPKAGFSGPVDITYTVCTGATPAACATATIHILVEPAQVLNPDAATAYINILKTGNISTNDVIQPGSTYAQPTQQSGATITMNADGTYDFTATEPGTYTYVITVCAPGQTTNCPTENLVITVPVNTLVDNTATAYINVPSSGNISSNDVVPAGTSYGQPAQQTGATITMNTDGTYNFIATVAGTYTYTVPVCAPGQTTGCPTETLVITVPLSTIVNDAATAYINIPISGNISTNDAVPAGTSYGQPAQQSGATITINADGTYSFTATTAGTYTYTVPVCAPGQTTGCPTETLVITVPVNTMVDNTATAYTNIPTNGNISTNDAVPAGTSYGQPAQQTGATITINTDGTYSFTATAPGTYTYSVPVCSPGQTTNCPTEKLVITVSVKTIVDDTATAYINIPISGNISTNDAVPAGSSYGQPAQQTGATITVNANGTYSFTATSAGTYTYTVSVCAPGQTTNCPSETLVITVIGNQPQGTINLKYNTLLASDSVHVKLKVYDGVGPYTMIFKNSINSRIDTVKNLTDSSTIMLPPSNNDAVFTLFKIIDNNNSTRIANFDKDTARLTILKPKILLTLKAELPTKLPDNSFKTSILMKIKNNGGLYLQNVQVDADLSKVFPPDMQFVLDSVKVTSGNLTLNKTYTGFGFKKTTNYVSKVVNGFTIKYRSFSTLSGSDLFDNGVNLDINEEGSVVFYLTLKPGLNIDPLVLQFTSAGDGLLVQKDGNKSMQPTTSISHDNSNINAHPLVTTIGKPLPTYIPFFLVNEIGASLDASLPVIVNGGYVFSFKSIVKNYSNSNLDSVAASFDINQFIKFPDAANIYGTPTVIGTTTFNPNFDGKNDIQLFKGVSQLQVGDSIKIAFDLFVKTDKIKVIWPTYLIAKGITTTGDLKVTDTSTNGANPDPNGNKIPNESVRTLIGIGIDPPPAPEVIAAVYEVDDKRNPKNISSLIKKIPIGTVPTWCNVDGSACSMNPPILPNIVGTYIWCVKSLDTITGLTSTPCVYDTVRIIPINKYSKYDIIKSAKNIEYDLSGRFIVGFNIKVVNNTDRQIDYILIQDDLTTTFKRADGFKLLSISSSGTLVTNFNFDGISNIEMLQPESYLKAYSTDSIIMKILIESESIEGDFNNAANMKIRSDYGVLDLLSNDTVVNKNGLTNRVATKFKVPKIELNIPGGFSPNNDGIDDTWKIQRPFGTKISVQVFNRWGNEVYSNSDYKNDWRGIGVSNFMGENVVEGTYFYIVLATDRDGAIKKFAGSLTIVR